VRSTLKSSKRGPHIGSFKFRLWIALIEILTWPLAWLPPPIGLALGAWVGRLFFLLSANRRHIATANIEMIKANGFLPPKIDSRSAAMSSFANLGRSAWEALCFYHRGLAPFLKYIHIEEGAEYLRQAITVSDERGVGIVLTTGHCGNWELMCHFVSHVTGRPMTIIGRDSGHTVVDELVRRLRTKGGNHYAPKNEGAKAMLTALRMGQLVGTLIDQAVITGHVAAMIPFMGREATTNLGPIRLAHRTKSILLMVLFRRNGRHHYMTVKGFSEFVPIENDLLKDAARLNQWLGEYIRQYPDQWMWGHRRWKSKSGVQKDCRSII